MCNTYKSEFYDDPRNQVSDKAELLYYYLILLILVFEIYMREFLEISSSDERYIFERYLNILLDVIKYRLNVVNFFSSQHKVLSGTVNSLFCKKRKIK